MKKVASLSLIGISILQFILGLSKLIMFYTFNDGRFYSYRVFNSFRVWELFRYSNSLLLLLTIVMFSILIFSYTKYNNFILIPGILYIIFSLLGIVIFGTSVFTCLGIVFLILAFILIKPYIKTSYIPLITALIFYSLYAILVGRRFSLLHYYMDHYGTFSFNLIPVFQLFILVTYSLFLVIFLLNYMNETDQIPSTTTDRELITSDSLGRIGAILNLLSGVVGILSSIIILILIFTTYSFDINYTLGGLLSILLLASLVLNSISIVYNTDFLKGNQDSKMKAIIFGIITGSILGSILILLSKPEGESTFNNTQQPNPYSTEDQTINRLYKYKQMLNDELITEEEFNDLKKKLLSELD
ncbi:SHOCT domain-containing protein [Haloplasma contractile]|uniref:SHOCT domain-containing protein n=1 Tax=Haloplasma contractile SSD-17B TaxID=1033810 RepID=U2DVA8_9MOLU|nr:SHOCT domain-containing protein [Haloplasma contractile]ERJ12332.1 hypothetical protein HLPCO_001318 [Haloplasma contractile SSD-17B]